MVFIRDGGFTLGFVNFLVILARVLVFFCFGGGGRVCFCFFCFPDVLYFFLVTFDRKSLSKQPSQADL